MNSRAGNVTFLPPPSRRAQTPLQRLQTEQSRIDGRKQAVLTPVRRPMPFELRGTHEHEGRDLLPNSRLNGIGLSANPETSEKFEVEREPGRAVHRRPRRGHERVVDGKLPANVDREGGREGSGKPNEALENSSD